MKVSTDSWHFRLMMQMLDYQLDVPWNRPPSTLCKYFWTTVGCVLAFPWWKLVNSLGNVKLKPTRKIAWARIFRICIIGWCVGWGIWDMSRGFYITAGVMFGFAMFQMLPRGYISGLIDEYERKHRNENMVPAPVKERKVKKKKLKEPNLFLEYFKARKQKVCPLLEFVDPRDEEFKNVGHEL